MLACAPAFAPARPCWQACQVCGAAAALRPHPGARMYACPPVPTHSGSMELQDEDWTCHLRGGGGCAHAWLRAYYVHGSMGTSRLPQGMCGPACPSMRWRGGGCLMGPVGLPDRGSTRQARARCTSVTFPTALAGSSSHVCACLALMMRHPAQKRAPLFKRAPPRGTPRQLILPGLTVKPH